jgi:dynein intermediate chain 1
MKLSKTKLKATSKAGLTASNVKLMTQSKAGKRFQGAGREDDDILDEDAEEQWTHSKVLVKPDDQLQLTEQELKEEFTRILTANNPHAPNNIVRYNFKERAYKATSSVDQLAIHFSIDGYMVHKDSDEALRQLARQGNAIDEVASQQSIGVETGTQTAEPTETEEKKVEGGEGEGGGAEEAAATPAPPSGKKLTNQFNFSNRATQTYNNTLRSTETMTEPPPRVTFSGSATQWEIHDAYVEDLERQEREKEKKQPSKLASKEEGRKKKTAADYQGEDLSRMIKPAKIIERMVNQNVYDEIAQDFKYWEDESDEFKGGQGTLLPLWKFTYSKAKKLMVTAICWNAKYKDLMAVGFGSYEFLNQVSGMICLYSLKNPSFPEFVIENPDSGVLCIDIHSEHPSLIAVGHYDGTVAVYDVKQSCKEPQYRCDARTGQHLDPVWEVRWQKNDLDNNMNFYSVAADGRVVCWTIVKNELRYSDAMVLKVPEGPVASGPGGMQVHGHGTV